jgi:hypothetical protein
VAGSVIQSSFIAQPKQKLNAPQTSCAPSYSLGKYTCCSCFSLPGGFPKSVFLRGLQCRVLCSVWWCLCSLWTIYGGVRTGFMAVESDGGNKPQLVPYRSVLFCVLINRLSLSNFFRQFQRRYPVIFKLQCKRILLSILLLHHFKRYRYSCAKSSSSKALRGCEGEYSPF